MNSEEVAINWKESFKSLAVAAKKMGESLMEFSKNNHLENEVQEAQEAKCKSTNRQSAFENVAK